MKLEDVKVGMKVVPFKKSTGENYSRYFDTDTGKLKNGREYLLVTYILISDKVLLGDELALETKEGDFFYPSDFSPYSEKEELDLTVKTDNATYVTVSNGDMSATAKCDLRFDTFDIATGFHIAYTRLLEVVSIKNSGLHIGDIVVTDKDGYFGVQGRVVSYDKDTNLFTLSMVNGKTIKVHLSDCKVVKTAKGE